jgi:hypothetical protein
MTQCVDAALEERIKRHRRALLIYTRKWGWVVAEGPFERDGVSQYVTRPSRANVWTGDILAMAELPAVPEVAA